MRRSPAKVWRPIGSGSYGFRVDVSLKLHLASVAGYGLQMSMGEVLSGTLDFGIEGGIA